MGPIRCHSPFTYDDMKMHARRELDKNLCSYACKLILLLFCVIIPSVLVIVCLKPRRYGSLNNHVRDGLNSSSENSGFDSNARGHGSSDSYRTIRIIVMLFLPFLLVIFACQTGCLFYSPLKRLIAQLNQAKFWAMRGVKIFLTRPAEWCTCCCGGCYAPKQHCVVFQYGLNGQPFQQVIYIQQAQMMMTPYMGAAARPLQFVGVHPADVAAAQPVVMRQPEVQMQQREFELRCQ